MFSYIPNSTYRGHGRRASTRKFGKAPNHRIVGQIDFINWVVIRWAFIKGAGTSLREIGLVALGLDLLKRKEELASVMRRHRHHMTLYLHLPQC